MPLQKMPGMRGRTLPRVPGSKHGAPLTLHDKTTVLLLQADALNILGKKPEAQKILAKAAKVGSAVVFGSAAFLGAS